MIKPERINFLTNRIASSLRKLREVSEKEQKALRSTLEEGFDLLEKIREEAKKHLFNKGMREGESGWNRELKAEYERRIKNYLRRMEVEKSG